MSNFTVSPNHGTTPLTVTFVAEAVSEAKSYLWNFGDGTAAVGQIVKHTYNGGGSYNVTLVVVFDTHTDLNEKNGVVIVSREGNFPSDFDGYAVGGSGNNGIPTGPAPLQAIFSGMTIDQSTGISVSFVWDFGDGTSQNLGVVSNPRTSHTYESPGTYPVKLTATMYGPDGKQFNENAFTRYPYVVVT